MPLRKASAQAIRMKIGKAVVQSTEVEKAWLISKTLTSTSPVSIMPTADAMKPLTKMKIKIFAGRRLTKRQES